MIPPEFTVQGGVERGHSRQLVLQTDEGRDQALEILSGALTSVGFLDVESLTGRNRTGFLSERDLAVRTFCRDDAGVFGVTYVTLAGVAHVIMNATGPMQASGPQSCAEMGQPPGFASMPGRPGPMLDVLSQHMPVMTVPAAADTSRRAYLSTRGGSPSGGSFSGGGTFETSSEFGSDMSIPQLYQHFAEQIGSQGWALDSEATGQLSASGNWIKIPDADNYLHGAFNIIQNSESNFTIRFRLTKLSVEQ